MILMCSQLRTIDLVAWAIKQAERAGMLRRPVEHDSGDWGDRSLSTDDKNSNVMPGT